MSVSVQQVMSIHSLQDSSEVDMAVSFEHHTQERIEPRPKSRSIGKRRWLDGRPPLATVVLGALLMSVWLAALIGFAVLLARAI
jgi:anti-sigma factor RsiW